MMLYPSIIDLMKKSGNRYSLVIAAAKRARQISEEAFAETEVSLDGARSITTAAKEIADGDVEIINSDNNETVEETENDATDSQPEEQVVD